ncbi:ER lumen protein-retaining receptor-like isoform X3 [Durio zibethinus]|uniref:ER lumen protein-retaining receptor-like isoform X3 n=1 Tax=Durio zibethinus TaxID=66656 RepID=A0A6P6B355_DURZI|nr:ER lumen protein-retaining receptor-like isoform X3 [Durio zibethinus]
MNIFRLAGDMTHLAGILVLLLKIHSIKSCAEAVAILHQLVLLQRTRNIDNLTGQYVFLLGLHSSHVYKLVYHIPFKLFLWKGCKEVKV